MGVWFRSPQHRSQCSLRHPGEGRDLLFKRLGGGRGRPGLRRDDVRSVAVNVANVGAATPDRCGEWPPGLPFWYSGLKIRRIVRLSPSPDGETEGAGPMIPRNFGTR